MTQSPIEDGFHLSDTRLNLPMNLLRLRERIMAEFRPILSAHGVTEQQWRVLRVLDGKPPMDASELARQASILSPSLSRILKTLAAQSYVALDRDAGDGRRTMIRLTDQGSAFIRDVLPESAAAYRRLEGTIGTERMRHLMEMLGETLELLDAGERE